MRTLHITAQRVILLSIFVVLSLGAQLYATTSVACKAGSGVQFNLEPSTHAVPQQVESVDFIPNAVGLGLDLVVAGAYDFRGAGLGSPAPAGVTWNGSVSGYYVHRST